MRRALRYLGILVLALAALLLAAFGVLQTPPGKALLASLGSSLASSPDLKVGISGIGGFVPFDMSVDAIELADAKGPFGRVEQARLALRAPARSFGTLERHE